MRLVSKPVLALLGSIALMCAGVVMADYTFFNMPVGVTPVSQAIYKLHMIIFWICVAIGVGVFGVMFYAIIMHRKSVGATAASFHESTKVEIIWTIIPFLILIAMAVPATKTLLYLEDVEDSDLTVKITGYMWRWHYDYVDNNVSFMSNLATSYEQQINRAAKSEHYLREVDNPLVLPINKKIRLLTTANDVIHSWWVADLAVKKDAIPGFINETWTRIEQPGIYRGQCAELCGAKHGFMPIVVHAVTEQEFEAWLAKQKQSSS